MPNLRSEISVNIVQRELQVKYAHAFKKALVNTLDLGKDTFTFGIMHPTRDHWMGDPDYLSARDWDECLFKLTKKICFYYGYDVEFLSELYKTIEKKLKLIKRV